MDGSAGVVGTRQGRQTGRRTPVRRRLRELSGSTVVEKKLDGDVVVVAIWLVAIVVIGRLRIKYNA